jgi:D-inositol-3-phosphate glycosyltransferase
VKVLLQSEVDAALPGGLETHLRELAAALAARGHEVALMGRASAPIGVPAIERPEIGRYDVVHHHGGRWPAALAGARALVTTLHFCVAAKMATYVRLGRLQTLANLPNWAAVAGERRAARRRGRVVAVSARVRDDFGRWHALAPSRVTVIPNGIRPGEPRQTRTALRARWGLANDAPVLLTIGREDFVKGYDLLERAWRATRAKRPEATWVTVGGAATHCAPGRLVTGPLPHSEVTDWIHAADFGALPSYYEGCSVALLEMLAGRLYTLAHDVGNAAEVVRSRENGEVLPREEGAWREELARLLAAPPGRAPAGLPPEYDWASIAAATEQVYRAAVDESR